MKIPPLARLLPSWENALLAAVAAVLLILSFPDFEYWYLAWFAMMPLLWAIEREKASVCTLLADPAVLRDGVAAATAKSRLLTLEAKLAHAVARWEELETIASDA